MPDWLQRNLSPAGGLTWQDQGIRMIAALLLGLCVAALFRISHGRRHDRAAMMMATLVLLSVLISMVSMVIGGSVALAFSLVGALSIVRFRTVVDDTRDTAFVIFAVVVGMAAGAGHLRLALLGLPVTGGVAFLLSRWQAPPGLPRSLLTIRLGLHQRAEEVVRPILSSVDPSARLVSAATAKQGAALELSYSLVLQSPADVQDVVSRLNRTEGVQGVELRPES